MNQFKMSEEKIWKIEEILGISNCVPEKKYKKIKKVKKKNTEVIIPKGTPKSGRFWKSARNRFSSVIKTRGYKKANKFEKLQALKKELNRVRNISNSIKEKRQQKIEKKKERRRENIKRQTENSRKSEIVQVIKNSAKVKRMKKKQLRAIEKRDTLNKS